MDAHIVHFHYSDHGLNSGAMLYVVFMFGSKIVNHRFLGANTE